MTDLGMLRGSSSNGHVFDRVFGLTCSRGSSMLENDHTLPRLPTEINESAQLNKEGFLVEDVDRRKLKCRRVLWLRVEVHTGAQRQGPFEELRLCKTLTRFYEDRSIERRSRPQWIPQETRAKHRISKLGVYCCYLGVFPQRAINLMGPIIVVQAAHNTLSPHSLMVVAYLWGICIISSRLRMWLTNSEGLHRCLI